MNSAGAAFFAAGGIALGVLLAVVLARVRHRRRGADPTDGTTGSEQAAAEGVLAAEVIRQIPEAMSLALFVFDRAGSVALASPALARFAVISGGHVAVDQLRDLVEVARREGPTEQVVSVPTSRPGRETAAVAARAVPLRQSGYVAVFLHDITEALRVEATRRDFVLNVGHELKTPVGALTLLGETIQEAADDPVAVRRFAGRVRQEGSRLAALVQELIELSKLEGPDARPVPTETIGVDAIIDDAIERTRLAAEQATIGVVTSGDRGLYVTGEHRQLTTAVANLISNAIAYSPSNTRVTVGTRLRPPTSADGPGQIGAAPYVEITVADQGIGIGESDLGRIFERFYRADPARSRATGGTGLGLAIVKHIVSNHRGDVEVESAPGSGSTFTLRLPKPAPAGPEPPDNTDDPTAALAADRLGPA